jgi:hypothetical protein
MKIIVFIILTIVCVNSFAKCTKETYGSEWINNEPIYSIVCSDSKNGQIQLSKVSGDWARALVNHKTLYYLYKEKDKWTIIAKGNKFVIQDWEKYKIPSGIR